MAQYLNLDELLVNTEIQLKGKVYTVPPMTYELSRKFLSLKKAETEEETDKAMFSLIAEYLNTNIEKTKVTIEDLEKTLRNRQLMALFQHIVDDIKGIEKK